MRRLPIFLLIDVSESMAGDNLRQLQEGMDRLVRSLRTDPYALETAYLSVIVFAGKARTLTPLVELYSFYPPHLPLGSGTSLGGAMMHLMDEIDRSVVRATSERKGDWKPVVYLMTDGKPTDDVEAALTRWKNDYERRVNLVAIGIGPYASQTTLLRFTENTLHLDDASEESFKRFVDWISASVAAQSRSVSTLGETGVNLAKLDETVLEKITRIAGAVDVDEDFVIITGCCQTTHLPYLMKYEHQAQNFEAANLRYNVDRYNLVGVYAAEKDFYDLSDDRTFVRTVSSEALMGAPGCPHCGNPYGFAACSCGQILCVKGDGPATCPKCKTQLNMGIADGGFDVQRSRG